MIQNGRKHKSLEFHIFISYDLNSYDKNRALYWWLCRIDSTLFVLYLCKFVAWILLKNHSLVCEVRASVGYWACVSVQSWRPYQDEGRALVLQLVRAVDRPARKRWLQGLPQEGVQRYVTKTQFKYISVWIVYLWCSAHLSILGVTAGWCVQFKTIGRVNLQLENR